MLVLLSICQRPERPLSQGRRLRASHASLALPRMGAAENPSARSPDRQRNDSPTDGGLRVHREFSRRVSGSQRRIFCSVPLWPIFLRGLQNTLVTLSPSL